MRSDLTRCGPKSRGRGSVSGWLTLEMSNENKQEDVTNFNRLIIKYTSCFCCTVFAYLTVFAIHMVD